jgi:hypothetical protein
MRISVIFKERHSHVEASVQPVLFAWQGRLAPVTASLHAQQHPCPFRRLEFSYRHASRAPEGGGANPGMP